MVQAQTDVNDYTEVSSTPDGCLEMGAWGASRYVAMCLFTKLLQNGRGGAKKVLDKAKGICYNV